MVYKNEVEKTYQGARGKSYQDSRHRVGEHGFELIARSRLRKIRRYIKPTDSVLEFGVGQGWNLAKVTCRERVGYDIGEEPERLKKYGILFVQDLKEIADKRFDIIICHHVLEHVPDPVAVLQQISGLLAKDGKLLLFSPWETQFQYKRFNKNEPNHHLFSWNVQSLGNLLTACGFEVVEYGIIPFGYERRAAVITEKLRASYPVFLSILALLRLIRPVAEIKFIARLLDINSSTR
jgi:SAM-dependent methyltransferase